MAIQVWKIPAGYSAEQIRNLVGSDGNLLNPILDGNGNLILSQEEYNNPEFEKYKRLYSEIINAFELIDFVPNPDLIADI
jgi:hypothetical protein